MRTFNSNSKSVTRTIYNEKIMEVDGSSGSDSDDKPYSIYGRSSAIAFRAKKS